MNTVNLQPGTTQLRFTPVSRTFSNVGTTVSYSLNPGTNISAYNPQTANLVSAQNANWMTSGQFANYVQPNWNTANYVNFTPIARAGFTNFNPVVTANQFGQFTSGVVLPHTVYISSPVVQPSVDISETSSDVVITAYVSNFGINDLHLDATDNSVTISGTAWTGRENVVLNRTVPLPTSIRAESVDAHYQSGVVEIRCPKLEKQSRQRATISSDISSQQSR